MAHCRPLKAASRTGDSGCGRSETRRIHFERSGSRGVFFAHRLPLIRFPAHRPIGAATRPTWVIGTDLAAADLPRGRTSMKWHSHTVPHCS
jgi:hypothetical protein